MRKALTCSITALLVFFTATGFSPAKQAAKEIILATTTSTQDTGLLDVLLPMFKKNTGFIVKTIAVGSGQAMAMGERGEADVLLVHSPAAEKSFMKNNFGINRRIVMHNDFIIVGPPSDPAGISGMKSAVEAFRKIASAGSLFISRGDNSGTHVKELNLWKDAGISAEGRRWYQQTGLGMGQTLGVVAEKGAYTLSDRSTYLAMKKNLNLNALVQGDARLKNIYHVIEVNPAKWPRVNNAGAHAFAEFILSPEVQKIIGRFGKDTYGEPLYYPDAGTAEKE